MKTVTMIILVVGILTAGTARADDENLVYGPVPEAPQDTEFKSPGMATGLSVGGFLFPIIMTYAMSTGGGGDTMAGILIMTGSIFGPGLGHAYAGNTGQFWKGAGLRTLGWGGFAVAVAASWDNPDASGAAAIAVGSSVLYLASSIYDMATADNSAKKYNERLEASRVSVTPTWSPKDDAVGLSVAIGF